MSDPISFVGDPSHGIGSTGHVGNRSVDDAPAPSGQGVSVEGVLVPRVATKAMVQAADACTDAYSAWAAMVEASHVC